MSQYNWPVVKNYRSNEDGRLLCTATCSSNKCLYIPISIQDNWGQCKHST